MHARRRMSCTRQQPLGNRSGLRALDKASVQRGQDVIINTDVPKIRHDYIDEAYLQEMDRHMYR